MATVNLKDFPLKEEITCPECSKVITLYDPAGTEFCVCGHCHSYLQFKDQNVELVKKVPVPQIAPIIAIGSQGSLDGYDFIVIAYTEKKERYSEYKWREYLLYNHLKGYGTLSEFDGHWNLVYGADFLPDLKEITEEGKTVRYNDVEYNLFHKYESKVISLTGEFDWSALEDKMVTKEFVAPPYLLIREAEKANQIFGVNFYQGEYQQSKTVAAAFGVDPILMPSQVGIAATQPAKWFERWNWSWQLTLYAVLAIMIGTLFLALLKPQRTIFDDTFNLVYEPVKDQYEFRPFKTKTFDLKDISSSVLEVDISSDVSNNWLEATMVLINEATNESWEVTKGVEYYSGFEDGESWTEGSKSAEVLLSEIPNGKYHFNIYTASGDPLRNQVSIKVTANKMLWRNIFVSILFLAILPIFTYFMSLDFEKKRWYNSDYSPYDN